VVRDLKATAEYDWDGFLRRRVEAPQEALPLDVVGLLGYRLKYAERPPGNGVLGAPPDNPAADSLGLSLRGRGGGVGRSRAAGGQGRARPRACG
jgi:hypothetical protein